MNIPAVYLLHVFSLLKLNDEIQTNHIMWLTKRTVGEGILRIPLINLSQLNWNMSLIDYLCTMAKVRLFHIAINCHVKTK